MAAGKKGLECPPENGNKPGMGAVVGALRMVMPVGGSCSSGHWRKASARSFAPARGGLSDRMKIAEE